MPRFCPRLESLEDRSCPAAPAISLTATAAGNSMVTLSGVVADDMPANLWIMFSGAYSGDAMTDANGNFSVTVTPDQTGTVTAAVYDMEGFMTEATAELHNDMPMIVEFNATHDRDNIWIFSGRLTDDAPEGLEVQLWGCPSIDGVTVTVAADGTFSVSVQLTEEESEGAYITATVIDWWQQMGAASLILGC